MSAAAVLRKERENRMTASQSITNAVASPDLGSMTGLAGSAAVRRSTSAGAHCVSRDALKRTEKSPVLSFQFPVCSQDALETVNWKLVSGLRGSNPINGFS